MWACMTDKYIGSNFENGLVILMLCNVLYLEMSSSFRKHFYLLHLMRRINSRCYLDICHGHLFFDLVLYSSGKILPYGKTRLYRGHFLPKTYQSISIHRTLSFESGFYDIEFCLLESLDHLMSKL